MKTAVRPYSRWVAECLPEAFHPSQQDPTEPAGVGSSPVKDVPQQAQPSGFTSTTRSTRSAGSGTRPCPACPGCPPLARPDGRRGGRGGALGGSDDGGLDEVREVLLACSSNRATRSSRSATTTRTIAGVAA